MEAKFVKFVPRDNLSLKEAAVKVILERYNHGVLRAIARRYLPQDARHEMTPKMRRSAFGWWSYMVHRAPKCELMEALFPYVNKSVESECEEMKIYLSMRGRLKERHNGRNSVARRAAHKKYEQEKVNPIKKKVRHYMAAHPELIAQIKEKHDLA